MLRRFLVTLLVSAAMGLPQTVPPPPFLPPASAGAGVAVGTTPLGGGVGVGAVSAFPSQPYIPDVGADIELVKVSLYRLFIRFRFKPFLTLTMLKTWPRCGLGSWEVECWAFAGIFLRCSTLIYPN
jgi:hypothetical protein